MLTEAVTLAHSTRGWRTRPPTLIALSALMAYVWLLFHSTIYVIITWRWPESVPHTFAGVETLASTLTFGNALWTLLIGANLVDVWKGPRHARRSSLLPLLLALAVVVLLQQFALLVMESAHW